ncbi:hypothetical protein HD806DRAFT_539281 [Xylariaceae sp. AK1471]|nr:hypothetical protein HD806DRAFT_539281 [Xylariaceae sp. AK1471]
MYLWAKHDQQDKGPYRNRRFHVWPVRDGPGDDLALAIYNRKQDLLQWISPSSANLKPAMWYFFSSLAGTLAVFVGPPLASKLIEVWSPWVPMSLSLVATTLVGAVVFLTLETSPD